jgi:methionine sulfoxide reductase heme-binding subunit
MTLAVTGGAVVLTAVLYTLTFSGDAFWSLDRAAGEVTFLLLTATVLFAVLRSAPHVDIALATVAFAAVHVASTILSEQTGLGPVDAVVPFVAAYRGTWVGLGVISAYLYVAVIVTSWPLRRLPRRWWTWLHRTIYVAWGLAIAHALGAGSDARSPVYLALDVLAVFAVVTAVAAVTMRRRARPTASREIPS